MPKGVYDRYEVHRKKIQTGNLIDIAQKIAKGEMKGDPKVLAVRLQAIKTLLGKSMPDLSSVGIGNEAGNAEGLKVTVETIAAESGK